MSRPLSFTSKRALAVPQDEFEAAPQKPIVVVTGGSGKLGRATVVELQQHGWQVINMDRAPSPKDAPTDAIYMYADLEDMGQVIENLIEVDTVRLFIDCSVFVLRPCCIEIQSACRRRAPRCSSRSRNGCVFHSVPAERHVVRVLTVL